MPELNLTLEFTDALVIAQSQGECQGSHSQLQSYKTGNQQQQPSEISMHPVTLVSRRMSPNLQQSAHIRHGNLLSRKKIRNWANYSENCYPALSSPEYP